MSLVFYIWFYFRVLLSLISSICVSSCFLFPQLASLFICSCAFFLSLSFCPLSYCITHISDLCKHCIFLGGGGHFYWLIKDYWLPWYCRNFVPWNDILRFLNDSMHMLQESCPTCWMWYMQLLEHVGSHWVRSVAKKVLHQNPPCDCFGE